MFRERSKGSSYRGRGRARNESMKPKGLFTAGVWHCDCNPRLPANRFKVKKEGPNEGRWFYCCQKDKQIGCNFFLWESEAEPRMQAAVLHNSTSEPDHPLQHATSTTEPKPPHNSKLAPPPPLPAQPLHIPPKRKLPWLEDDTASTEDDEPFPWSPTQAEAQALSSVVDKATNSRTPAPETPRKAQKTSAFATPHQQANKTSYANGLPTPSTSNRKPDYLSVTPYADTVTPHTTPTPARFHDALSKTPINERSGDLVGEVFAYLGTTLAVLTPEQASGLRGVLERHTLKTQGIVKGRDVLRGGIQAREEAMGKMRQRVAALESELESQRAVTRHLRQVLAGGQ